MRAQEQLRPAFTDPHCLYELKFDGYRCMARIEADDGTEAESEIQQDNHNAARVTLQTKSGADCTAWFPELWAPLGCLTRRASCPRRRGWADMNPRVLMSGSSLA